MVAAAICAVQAPVAFRAQGECPHCPDRPSPRLSGSHQPRLIACLPPTPLPAAAARPQRASRVVRRVECRCAAFRGLGSFWQSAWQCLEQRQHAGGSQQPTPEGSPLRYL